MNIYSSVDIKFPKSSLNSLFIANCMLRLELTLNGNNQSVDCKFFNQIIQPENDKNLD